MTLNHFLNAILTGLSVSTVLITLMSFLIFKLRQFPKSTQESDERFEGTYFRRYDPYRISAKVAASIIPLKVDERRRFRTTAVGFFAAISFTIIVASLVQNWLSEPSTGRTTNVAESKPANLRKRSDSKQLIFDSKLAAPSIKESVSQAQFDSLAHDLALLKSEKITLIQSPDSQAKFSQFHKLALEAWQTFLLAGNIPVEIASLDRVPNDTTVIILPQLTSLSTQDRTKVQALLQRKIGVLVTGAIGALGADGRPAPTDWSGRTFGVIFSTNANAQRAMPSIFAADRTPYAGLPPGLLSNWFPTDNAFVASAKESNSTTSFEADDSGQLSLTSHSRNVARAVFNSPTSESDSRTGWLAFDPIKLEKLSEADQFYAKSFLVRSIKWLARQPTIEMATWKNGAATAFLASVDAEDKFDGASTLMRTFAKSHTPATFFVVSDLLVKDPKLARAASQEAASNFELASHTTDHADLLGMSPQNQFDKIQDSRFAIEDLTKKPVRGFRPPEERYDTETLNVAVQNGIRYFFGDQKFYRFAPLKIADGKLTYFPRSVFDDFNLVGDKTHSNEAVLQKMKSEFTRVSYFGGAYFLSTHSQVFGQAVYQPVMEDFLSYVDTQQAWKTNYADMDQWWRARDQVQVEIARASDHQFEVHIRNLGESPLEGAVFWLDAPGAGDWSSTGKTAAAVTPHLGHLQIKLSRLGAHEDLRMVSRRPGSNLNSLTPPEGGDADTLPAEMRAPAAIDEPAKLPTAVEDAALPKSIPAGATSGARHEETK